MKLVNLTPHEIRFYATTVSQGGQEEHGGYETLNPSGEVARVEVSQKHQHNLDLSAHTHDDYQVLVSLSSTELQNITGLPDPVTGTTYIVSGIVLEAAKAIGRKDCLAPNTAKAKRDDKGHITGVPGFVT